MRSTMILSFLEQTQMETSR